MDLAPVDAHAVPREAALLEVLAVVGSHDHQRVLEQPPAPELVEEAADLLVEIGDAALVTVLPDGGGLPVEPGSFLIAHGRSRPDRPDRPSS